MTDKNMPDDENEVTIYTASFDGGTIKTLVEPLPETAPYKKKGYLAKDHPALIAAKEALENTVRHKGDATDKALEQLTRVMEE